MTETAHNSPGAPREDGPPPTLSEPFTACKRAQAKLLASYDEHRQRGGWEAVGDAVGVSGTMAYRVANEGYQPRDPEIRALLGLPQLTPKLCADLLEYVLALERVEG